MLATFNSMLVFSLEPLVSTFTDRQQEIVNESGYSELMRNSSQIINCACFFHLAISMRLQSMQNHVAVAVRQALVGDVTRMKTMIIGGAGALPCRLR